MSRIWRLLPHALCGAVLVLGTVAPGAHAADESPAADTKCARPHGPPPGGKPPNGPPPGFRKGEKPPAPPKGCPPPPFHGGPGSSGGDAASTSQP